jgi:imidazolonepropionase-like amidohydrolase
MSCRFRPVLALLAFLAACGPPPAAEVALPSTQPPSVLVRDVSVLDVDQEAVLRHRDVLLEGGYIREISRAGSASAPEGALVVDGSGATLLPGLIDMHGHVTAATAPTWNLGLPYPEGNLRSYLYSGVTSVLDPGDPGDDAFERRERVARGELIGPRIFTAGPMLTCADGHPIALVRAFAPFWIGWYLAPRMAVGLGSNAEAEAEVDALAARGADFIKVTVDRIPLDAPRMDTDMIAAIVARARSHGLRTLAHIGTTQDAIDAGNAGIAAWAHGVYKERIPDEQIPVLAGFGIPMVVTVEVFDRYARSGEAPWKPTPLETQTVPPAVMDAYYPIPDDFDRGPLAPWLEQARTARPHLLDNVRRLHEAGVVILAGSDAQSGVFAGPGLHRELAQLVEAGLTPTQAIRAATLDAARFLDASDEPDFGSVAVGKRADLLLVDGDPSLDLGALSQIREVFVGGLPLERTDIATVIARAD